MPFLAMEQVSCFPGLFCYFLFIMHTVVASKSAIWRPLHKVLWVNTYQNNNFFGKQTLNTFSTCKFHYRFHRSFPRTHVALTEKRLFFFFFFGNANRPFYSSLEWRGCSCPPASLRGRGVADAVEPGQLSCARGAQRRVPCRNRGPAGARPAAVPSRPPERGRR